MFAAVIGTGCGSGIAIDGVRMLAVMVLPVNGGITRYLGKMKKSENMHKK